MHTANHFFVEPPTIFINVIEIFFQYLRPIHRDVDELKTN